MEGRLHRQDQRVNRSAHSRVWKERLLARVVCLPVSSACQSLLFASVFCLTESSVCQCLVFDKVFCLPQSLPARLFCRVNSVRRFPVRAVRGLSRSQQPSLLSEPWFQRKQEVKPFVAKPSSQGTVAAEHRCALSRILISCGTTETTA